MIRDWPSELAQARAARAAGDPAGAARRLSPAMADPAAPDEALRLLAASLRAGDRTGDAIAVLEALVRRQPASTVAEHNLAAALGDCSRARESEQAARRALAKGGRAPETWLVLGRALTAQGRLDEAGEAFRSALRLREDFLPAFRDLAQLVWMRDGDLEALTATLAPLAALARGREDAALLLSSILRDTAGDRAALDSLGPWLERGSVEVALAAAAAASGLDPALALGHARRALTLAPSDPRAGLGVAAAEIACGEPTAAGARLERHLARDPGDQYARALLLTAWRVAGDARALTPADYERLVQVYRLESGDAADRAAWLARTAAALRRLHPFRSHPFQQSVRHGAQSMIDPRAAGDPDIDRLFEALRAPIDAYVAGADGWRMSGAWSVKLAAGGRHTDHVHPRAWISSAVYIETPPEVDAGGHAGWLRFGAARIGAAFGLPAEHWVRPEPGTLVLFPSYLWHGTEPFDGPGERLTVAFDLQPGRGA
ncbi:putative 2OG-Fe(II) oxygenase [Brevundimonas sp.]|uniref:putative 2OG-Fe(II) oxygenase n=1 Tax=Brevundimonas sp. TaxID=1871086 RepID=UPI002D5CBB25|nr:putative 2OG-Fe(II) oxygenase [Brevundimonas sp.]HYC98842.1 putative 2OG-Fe(II) oxygenase [Brevundimonas sp.]